MSFLDITGLEHLWAQIILKLNTKVDKADGKGLSTNDYTTAEKNKLAGIADGAQVNTITGVKGDSESTYRTGNVNITKQNIGLDNVDNTADANKNVKYAASADSATSATKATQDASGNTITTTYETKTDANTKLTEAKSYADTAATNAANTVKNDLLNGAGAAYDTLKELGDLIENNTEAIDALETIAAGKADAEHNHPISDVNGLQSALDGKAASSHGTHVSYSTTAPVMDGTAAVGTASTVARSDHKHPTDTSRASKSDFDTHTGDTTKHITSTERTNWNAAKTHADSAHAPSNAEKNQNAFSNITVGSTTVAADTATDTVTFVGSNVTITPDATNDKITFAVADGSTSAKGVVQLTDSTSSTSTTTAATPNSVKSAYDLANTAKTNAATAQTKADSAYTLADGKVGSLSDLGITATSTELNYMDGVTSNVQTQLNGKSDSGHTHNYAGSNSAGGPANYALKMQTYKQGSTTETYGNDYSLYAQWISGNRLKLITDGYTTETDLAGKLTNSSGAISIGSSTKPVYFSNGVPVATDYTLGASVPSDAKFTDTTYSAGEGISLSGTKFSNSGVRSVTSGTAKGSISVNTNGTTVQVYVNGLKSAAYVDSTILASAQHDHSGVSISPSCIELKPVNTTQNNGGFIDFHYNRSGDDYTSRIIEESTGISISHSSGYSGRILVTSNIIAIYNAALTFSSGKATYTNSNIKSTSVCIVQRRSGTAGSATTSMYATTTNNGSLTVVTDNTSATTVNLNIFIFNL